MVRNITLSADEDVIRRARERAAREKRSFNKAFREWVARYADGERAVQRHDALMKRLDYVRAGRKFTRDEMNER